MSERQIIKLIGILQRRLAADLCMKAPDGYIVEVKPATRTLDQNSKLWPMLQDISDQVVWYGRRLSKESWKHIFTSSLKQQDVVPGLDGNFVVLGYSTSQMGKREFSDLIELIYSFGAEHDVVWSEKVREDGYV